MQESEWDEHQISLEKVEYSRRRTFCAQIEFGYFEFNIINVFQFEKLREKQQFAGLN